MDAKSPSEIQILEQRIVRAAAGPTIWFSSCLREKFVSFQDRAGYAIHLALAFKKNFHRDSSLH